jgi:Domain of unknown function (DUF4399)
MIKLTRRAAVFGAAMAVPAATFAQAPAALPTAPADAKLYIIWPHDGDRLKGPFWCRFGLRNMGVAPAGTRTSNTGHHHLLIDIDESLTPGETVPSDRNHIHFGAGQTETRLDLAPGRHTLQLVLGDADHRIFNPPLVSKKITITVL